MIVNLKSDVAAKLAFLEELKKRGYSDVRITRSPSDISATKDGGQYLFEVKYTRSPHRYFGAATLTEWEAAVANSGRYWFVVAYELNNAWHFDEYTVSEFMSFSYIPPFKIFFNVAVGKAQASKATRLSRKLMLNHERLAKMGELIQGVRK